MFVGQSALLAGHSCNRRNRHRGLQSRGQPRQTHAIRFYVYDYNLKENGIEHVYQNAQTPSQKQWENFMHRSRERCRRYANHFPMQKSRH